MMDRYLYGDAGLTWVWRQVLFFQEDKDKQLKYKYPCKLQNSDQLYTKLIVILLDTLCEIYEQNPAIFS